MPKKNYSLKQRWILAHPWLKLISLVLAVIVWLYVREEISRFNY
jgi:hypothetical protein